MPGPKSEPNKNYKHPVANPNKKAAKRLKARQDPDKGIPNSGYYYLGGNHKQGFFRKPGSQNRKK